MHVHVAGGDERQTAPLAELAQRGEPRRVVGAVHELGCDPRTARETLRHETRVVGIGHCTGHKQREATREAVVEVGALEAILPFGRAHARRA